MGDQLALPQAQDDLIYSAPIAVLERSVRGARRKRIRLSFQQRALLVLRLADKIEARKPWDGCWIWKGSVNAYGYGVINAPFDNTTLVYAHRIMFEFAHGAIPDDLQIDHLCRNRRCCNPAHLEAVTQRENLMRGEHPLAVLHRKNECSKGHSLDGAYVMKDGARQCRICAHERYVARKKAKAAA